MDVDAPTPPATGMIDIHSHLLPGIDDGCADIEETLESIRQLKERGFVGTICTPHIWPDMYPQNVPQNIQARVNLLRRELHDRGVDYMIWSGGEVRLFDGVIDHMKTHGVATLGNSKLVLTDFWDERWPKNARKAYQWLFDQGYQPILAHPERFPDPDDLEKNLAELLEMGVWLQGNSRCMTGEEGLNPDKLVRKFLNERKYRFFSLDMHRPDTLLARLEGLTLLEMEFGKQALDVLLVDTPRKFIFDQ